MSFRGTSVEIDLNATRTNARILRQALLPEAFFCPMIKANAYGHGAIKIARTLLPLAPHAFGVALIEEAIELRNAQIDSPILIFSAFDADSFKAAAQYGLTPMVSSVRDLECLVRLQIPLKVHLDFNTGMNRQGLDQQELKDVLKLLEGSAVVVEGVASHLHSADLWAEYERVILPQLIQFASILDQLVLSAHLRQSLSRIHMFNTQGIVGPALDYCRNRKLNWGGRPGIGIYGYGGGQLADSLGEQLQPAMKFSSFVQQIRKIEAGAGVSYGHSWRARRPSQIALLPVGYADGYSRHLSNCGHVMIHEELFPVVGRVCMDYTLVDVTDSRHPVVPGDIVTLWGGRMHSLMGLDELASAAGTISYEMLAQVSMRVPRYYVE